MGKKLYLECCSGISGDMTVAALLDLGADRQVLLEALKSLSLEGYRIQIDRVLKSGLDACDFKVVLDTEHENHDHDMEYLHGAKGHEHSHKAEVNTEGHVHVHRHLGAILTIIREADITERAKETAEHIFRILAEAEAKAHGVEVSQVHFHEVGAVDSIVDIIAAAVCLDNLDIEEVYIPKLYEGSGTVRCQHGILPIPVPAVANIAQAHGLILHKTAIQGELVTPTGAAIAAAVRSNGPLPDEFVIEKVGIGAGKRKYEGPGILRAMLIREAVGQKDSIFKLEANIDDCSGEVLGYAMECLFKAGARDVHYIPVYMKKNRPAYQMDIICDERDIAKLEQIVFEETTTIGIRRVRMERTVLERSMRRIPTPLGEAEVKVCRFPDGKERVYPEYSSVCALCQKNNLEYRQVYGLIIKEISGHTSGL